VQFYNLESWHVWTKVRIAHWISRGRDGRHCAAPKIVASKHDFGFAIWNSLDKISPSSREFDRRLSSLDTSIHWQHFVVFKQFRDVISVNRHLVVMKSTRSESNAIDLIFECLDEVKIEKNTSGRDLHDTRVTVALIDSRICGQKINVLSPLNVPHINSFSMRKYNRYRVVIVGTGSIL
jgi:hypothetical protein